MNILDGKAVAAHYQSQLAETVAQRKLENKRAPHLAAILVGNNPASEVYVNNKVKACKKVGFDSTLIELPEHTTEQELLSKISALNNDILVDGILVQLPLPKQINADKVIKTINPAKDVDGFHPLNIGKMVLNETSFQSATPKGIMMLLAYYNIQLQGKNAVVLGRSNIVGKPMSILLSQNNPTANATVTMCHSHTPNISEFTKHADVVVVALGKPNFLKGNMVKEGVIVVDVGINKVEDATSKSGHKLVGDVDFDEVSKKASYITPVPGGVGPMTITALLYNTLQACEQLEADAA